MANNLEFKPITEGLGFHPFSDGLPYAPLSKTASKSANKLSGADAETAAARARALLNGSTASNGPEPLPASNRPSTGLGATAAGPPRFAKQIPTLTSPSPSASPLRTPIIAANPVGTSGNAPNSSTALPIWSPVNVQPAPVNPKTATTTASPEPQSLLEFETESYGFGYLLRRMMAYLLDSAMNITLCVAGLYAVTTRQGIGLDTLSNPSMLLLGASFLLTFNWALIVAQEVLFNTTVFKRLFGLRLPRGAAAIFLRSFFFLPSLGFCGLGVLWALFDSRKRCWHDHVVDIQPERL